MKIFIGNTAPDDSYKSVGYRLNIDDFADNASCSEINAPTILDYVDSDKKEEFVRYLISKMRHGGVLVVGGTDIVTVSLMVFNKTLPINDANNVIFGTKNEPPKKSLSSLEEIRTLLINNGMKINKQIPGMQMLIVASRK